MAATTGFRHGVYISESPTPLTPPVQVDSAMPVVFGVAPVHKLEDPAAAVNVPMLIYNYSEGVQRLGYSDDWTTFKGIPEFLYSQFRIHNIAPVVFVNVWDPAKNSEPAVIADQPVINGAATIDDGMAMISTVKVIDAESDKEYIRNTDYTLSYDGDKLTVSVIKGGGIPAATATLHINYSKAVVNVTKADIAGGVDAATQKRKGIELTDEVFLRFQKNAGFLVAPGWSSDPEIAALLISKAKSLNNGNFRCIALLDLPSDGTFENYTEIPAWKNLNSYLDPFAFTDWACSAIGDRVFHASTRLAGMFGQVDAGNGGRPYEGASNKILQMTKMCREDGAELPMLDQGQANFLNENGIGTYLNWGGWREWGNETSAYPWNTDVKDAMRPIRRMFCWVQNTVNRTIWQHVDKPITRILIDTILLTVNQWFNALVAEGALLGGRVEFLKADNEQIMLMSGRIYFRIYLCPPGPAKEIVFDFQYDPNYLDTLFV